MIGERWDFVKVKNVNFINKTNWAFSETNEGNGDDRLKNRKRDRHTLESDRKNNFGELSSRDPGEKARERMRRPMPLGELSFQARRLIRHQGRQMEHKDVEQYLRDRGVTGLGQKNIEAVQTASERDRVTEQKTG